MEKKERVSIIICPVLNTHTHMLSVIIISVNIIKKQNKNKEKQQHPLIPRCSTISQLVN
jgi:hypothetical protein